ncbi:MAG: hypothetical protein ABJD07_04770 [Gemmatimonadaceae bacterium]
MDAYTFSLLLGGAGLGAMALSGLGHSSAGHSHGGHAHVGHSHAGHTHAGQTHAGQTHAGQTHAGQTHAGHARGREGWSLWTLASPRVLFSLVLGFGATGSILHGMLGGVALAGAAIVGGVLFERFVVSPVFNFALRFASQPALMLESCITDEAEVVSSFDARGQGLVAVEMDGQVVQVLGTLRPADVAAGVRVRMGDRVRIEEVDSARNRCIVSAL